MRGKRVRVRRDHPAAVAWALALAVTMLVVYLMTLGSGGRAARKGAGTGDAGARVTREVELGPLEVFCVQFGRFQDPGTARMEAARFVERGAAGFVSAEDGAYLVLGAGYAQRGDAERVCQRLKGEEGLEAELYARSAPSVRLRVTATEGQIQAILGTDAALRAQAERVEELAFQLDRGELTGRAARALLAVEASQVREILEQLEEIPGEDPVFSGLTEQMERFFQGLETLSLENRETDLFLSGKIKYNYISARLGYIAFLRGLG